MSFKRCESISVVFIAIGVVVGAIGGALAEPVSAVLGATLAALSSVAKHLFGKAAGREQEGTEQEPQRTTKQVERVETVIALTDPVDPGIHAEIDDAWKYVGRGQPQVTVDLLEKIKKRRWDRLSARERYRVLANVGNAKLAQQDNSGAAHSYLKAVGHQPLDADARALEALAYQLLNNGERAYKLATALVADEPQLGRAHMLRVRNAPKEVSLDDLLDAVPTVARAHPEVALALHDRAVGEGRLADAEQILRDFPDAEHQWAPLTLALGTTILHQEARALKMTLDGPIVNDTARLSEAADLFTRAMGQIPEGDPEGLRFSAHLNRGTARKLLSEFGPAHEDFRKAYDLRRTDAAAVIHFAWSAFTDRDDPDEAIALLSGFLEQNSSPEVELLLSECLWRREGEGDSEKAEQLLQGILPRLMDLEEADQRAEVVGILADLYAQSNRGEEAAAIFEGLPEGAVESSTLAAIRGEAFRKLERTDEALAEALAAAQALDDSTDWNVVRHVALLLERLDRYEEAFELWRKVAQPEFVSNETLHLLRSARKAGEDRFVIEFCRQLREAGHYDHRPLSHEVEVLTSYSEFTAAREALLDYLKVKPDDKIARLNLTILAIQHGWDDLVEGDPSSLPTVEELDSPGIGAAVADVLRAGPNPVQAVDYAYDLYQRFPEESSAHRALIVSVLAPGPRGLQIQKPTHVAPGVAVRYCEVGSEERRWLVVEDSDNSSLTRNEHPVSHPLANAMLGKPVGEEFPLSVGALRNPTGKILELLDKRVYRANELITGWKERFPNDPSFEAVPVRVSDTPTPDDFAEMRAIMKKLSESRKKLESAYASGAIPIATMANLRGKTVFETVAYLAANLELPVRASRGTAQDRTEAMDALVNAENMVLGPSSIATLALIEEVGLLDLLPIDFLVTEGTIRELRSLTQGDIPKASGYMGYEDGRLLLEEVDDEREEERLERLRTLTSSLEQACQIIGGGDLADVNASVREQLSGCLTPGAAESVAAAHRRGAVLWTDDHLLHEMVKGDLPSRRVWTDVVFQWALDIGIIKRERRSRAVARLLRHGYFFTGSSAVVVLDACEVALWRPEDPDLAAVLADFGSSAWTLEAALQITLETIARVWREAPTGEHARAVTARLLTHLADRPDSQRIIEALLQKTDSLVGLAITRADPLRQVLRVFQQGGIVTL